MPHWLAGCRLPSFALLLVLVCALPGLRARADDNWPQFRGPGGEGHSNSQGVPLTWSETENVRWKTPIHDRGWSSPVVWGQQIWMTTATADGSKMYAVCLDLQSGAVLHDIKLFENEKPSKIHDLNSYASPTPVIEPERIYVSFGSYGTACLDTQTGNTVWQRRDLPCEHFRGPGSSPILYKNLLITHFDGFDYQYVVALNKATGETVWKTNRDVDYGTKDGDIMKAFSTPLIVDVAGQTQMISTCSKAALAYNPDTGKEIWRVRHNKFSSTARPVYGHGLLYINTGYGSADLLAVKPEGTGDITDKAIVWKVSKSIGSKPSPLLVGDWIFGVHDSGVGSCLDALTGKEQWAKRLGGNYSASPIAVDGRLYFSNQEGQTLVIKPAATYEQLASNKLDDGCMASPAVVGKAIILRTKSAVYRLEEKDK